VPVPLLYDMGTMLEASLVLRPLVPRPYVAVCPSDARRLGLVHGAAVCVRAPGGSARALLRVVEGVPPGCALAPEGLAWTTPVAALMQGRRHAPVSIEAAGA
jgi:anaerobic selenocysteine-containing dehydrogenase